MKESTKDKAKGQARVIKGKIKEVVGKAVGNPKLEGKGKTEKLAGKIQKKVGQIEKVAGR